MKNEAGGGGSLHGNELKLDDQCLSSLPGWVVEFVSLRDGGRVCDDLALTRALGDLHLARYIEPVAHCNSVEIDVIDCPFVAVCCDGVWDVLSDQQAVDAVLATAPEYERGAAALRDLAFLHGSTDNVGCRHCHVAQTPPLKLTPRTYLSR
jgi:serine/threonine protein phosphatase PrpC